MPFFWVNSVFMAFFIVFTLVFLYFYKNMEMLNEMCLGEKVLNEYNMLW